MIARQTIYDRDTPVAEGVVIDDVALYEDTLWIGDAYISASRAQLIALKELLDSLLKEKRQIEEVCYE